MALQTSLRSNVFVPFPATTQGAGPVSIVKQNGIWTVSLLPFPQLNALPTSPPPDLSTKYVLVYDNVAGAFIQTTLANLSAQTLGAVQIFKNIVGRNGGFEVWQRLTGGATAIAVGPSVTMYTVDGWYLITGANQASTVSQVAALSNSKFAVQVQRNSLQTGVTQMIFAFPLDTDELNKFMGQNVLLSCTVKTGANWSPTNGVLSYLLAVGTGAPAKRGATPYPGEIQPLTGNIALTPGAAPLRFVSGVSNLIPFNGTFNQAELQFFWTPTGTAGANDFFLLDDVQLEVVPPTIGAQLTPVFERSDFIWDLLRCERFLPVFNAPNGAVIANGQATSGTNANFILQMPVRTRKAPTSVIVDNAAHFSATNSAGVGQTGTAMSLLTADVDAVQFSLTVASGLSAGNVSQLGSNNNAAQIIFSGCEI